MDFDETLIQNLIDSKPTWTLEIHDKKFTPEHVDITKSMIPVKKPSTRGGVYFSETEAYKIKCLISDKSIVSLLTSTMLGPNTDFTPLRIVGSVRESTCAVLANLTNYIQTKDNIQLNLVVTDVSLI